MRALILVATAALAVSACSKNDAAENTVNVDETMTAENVMTDDTLNADANAVDANLTLNADVNAVDANAMVDANATATNNAM